MNLKSGESLSGLMWQSRGRWLILRKASLLVPNNPPTPIDGEVVLERANVAFLQVP